jgi:hypothetical protein
MALKWSLTDVLRDHILTLRDERTQKLRVIDFIGFYGVPALGAGVAFLLNFQLKALEAAIGGMAIFTALLFGLLVQVFTLRIRVADSSSLRADIRLGRLIDQLEANVSYAVLVGITLTAVLVVTAGVEGVQDAASPVASAVAGGVFLHFLLSVAMVLKRLRSAYSSARY